MISVAALTTGANIPSSRFRIRQYISPLKSLGIEVREYCPFYDETQYFRCLSKIRRRYLPPVALAQFLLKGAARVPGLIESHKSQITWIERNILPGFEFPVHLTKKPRVLDVDDAIWMSSFLSGSSAKYLAQNVDVVIAGNSYIAEWYSNFCREVHIVPTAIDCHRFTPKNFSREGEDKPFIIGWTGTVGNFKYLKQIEQPLKKFFLDHEDAYLLVVADQFPKLLDLKNRVKFVKWDPEIEASILHTFDVGIMPLTDDNWTRGKCSFKMLQYMASGLPVIASPVGMNVDVLQNNKCGFFANKDMDWLDALKIYYKDKDLRIHHGYVGVDIVRSLYGLEVVTKKIASIFNSLL